MFLELTFFSPPNRRGNVAFALWFFSPFPGRADRARPRAGGRSMNAHTHSQRVDFAAVKAASLSSLNFIIPRLLPGGKRQGDEWVVRNPTRDDAKPGSFSVNMRTGVWSDFAFASDKGGDMIDLIEYLTRKSNLDAARELADMLGMTGGNTRGSSDVASGSSPDKSRTTHGAASPAESRVKPKEFPSRTPPNEKNKPFFVVAGEEGPKKREDEQRRHFYRRGGVPVRIKIMKKSGEKLKRVKCLSRHRCRRQDWLAVCQTGRL